MSGSSAGKSPGNGSSSQAAGHKGLLTPEERAIAALLAQGYRKREIARILSIDKRLVKQRRHDIFLKLGTSDPLEIILLLTQQRP